MATSRDLLAVWAWASFGQDFAGMADLGVGKASVVAAMRLDYRTAPLVSAATARVHNSVRGGSNCGKLGLTTVAWVLTLPN